jgi:hypothetical protein
MKKKKMAEGRSVEPAKLSSLWKRDGRGGALLSRMPGYVRIAETGTPLVGIQHLLLRVGYLSNRIGDLAW